MRRREPQRSRKGATLILVALLLVALVGLSGIAIDFSRMYLYKAQLQTTADAAAFAGAIEVNRARPTNATAVALNYAPRNTVDNTAATVAASDVNPGTWNFANGTFTQLGTWTDPAVNAVRVTAHYTGAYALGQVFGTSTQNLSAVAVAAKGYVGASSCLKPWAVDYQSMLNNLFGPGVKQPTYNLTAADIQSLSSNQSAITLLMDNSNPTAPGNIGEIIVDNPWNGNNSYKNAITGPCTNLEFGPGSWVSSNPGQGAGQSAASVKTLCGVNGNGNSFNCNVKVKLIVWDVTNGMSGSNLQYRVKYVAEFTVTHYNKGTGAGNSDQITGTFQTMASSGGFTGTPSPLTGSVGMVQ